MNKPKLDYGTGYNENNSIRIIWCIEDIKHLTDTPLTDDECMSILKKVECKHDASIGINWDVLEYYVDEYLEEKRRIKW